LHHLRQRHHARIVAGRAGERALVRGTRDAVPLVEPAVVRETAWLVAEVPLAEERGGVALPGDDLPERALPGYQPLRQPGRHRLHRTGADRMAAGHQRRAGRHAVALDVEVQELQPLRRERVDPRRRRAAKLATAVAAGLAPAEIVREDQNDIGPGRHRRLTSKRWRNCGQLYHRTSPLRFWTSRPHAVSSPDPRNGRATP